tara:strand:+ start:363 stop:743 length:381 start_codon:yes stop_codon:yes gene_type:complete
LKWHEFSNDDGVTMIYYHNPRCSKSREGLKMLEESNADITIKLYLTEKISYSELNKIIKKLNIKPIDLVRKNETIIKSNKIILSNMSDKDIVQTMIQYPILIERPIFIKGDKAVIGRPPELIKSIL